MNSPRRLARIAVVVYLRSYAAAFTIPVRLNTRVERLRRQQDIFEADTTDGQIMARHVVVATHEVVLAIGSEQSYLPQRILGRYLFWWFTRFGVMTAPTSTRRGRWMKQRSALVVGARAKDLPRRGVAVSGRAVQAIGRDVILQDGTRVQPTSVVWATGYAPDHSWIDIPGVCAKDGTVARARGWSDVAGLSFLGLTWQHTRGSALLGFVGDDVGRLADRIAARLSSRSASTRSAAQLLDVLASDALDVVDVESSPPPSPDPARRTASV